MSRTVLCERIQMLAARTLATHPVGHQLFLIGGCRYRLLNGSCRASLDMDYHWEGDLDTKMAAIADVVRRNLVPEVERQLAYEGDVRPATGPEGESPAVRSIRMAFFRVAAAGSRIEIPVEITRIPRLDPPLVRTVAGTVFLTVSDADMIESKVIALLRRTYPVVRDLFDIFLFQDTLPPDAHLRLARKLVELALSPRDVEERLARLQTAHLIHVREIERLLHEQVDSAAADHLRSAGGAEMIWQTAMRLVMDTLARAESGP